MRKSPFFFFSKLLLFWGNVSYCGCMIYCGHSGLKWGVRWGQCQEFDDSGCSNTSLTFEFKLTSHFDERAIQSKEPTCGKTSSVPRIIWSVAMLLSCLVSSSRHLCTPPWRWQTAWQGSQGGGFGSGQGWGGQGKASPGFNRFLSGIAQIAYQPTPPAQFGQIGPLFFWKENN